MDISKELLKKIAHIDDCLELHFPSSEQTEKEKVYARSVKLNEEVGELMSEVLASFNDQRKDKLIQSNNNELKKEFGDVIVTLLLLAKTMNIDINEALYMTIEKITKRFEEK